MGVGVFGVSETNDAPAARYRRARKDGSARLPRKPGAGYAASREDQTVALAVAPSEAIASSRSGRKVSQPYGSRPPWTMSKKASWSFFVIGPQRPSPMV